MKANFVPMLRADSVLRGAAMAALVLLCTGLPSAWALRSDTAQPLLVNAGSMHYDNVAQATVFTGDVVLTKGTLVLHAARVRVQQRADGYDDATAYGSASQPATFDQTLDAAPGQPRPTVHGRALELPAARAPGHAGAVRIYGAPLAGAAPLFLGVARWDGHELSVQRLLSSEELLTQPQTP